MATFTGHNGGISLGANVVAEVKNFSIEETAEPLDDSAMGDSTRTFKQAPITAWSGSAEVHYDPTDTNGQEAMSIGAELTGTFFPVENSAGNRQRQGTIHITSVGEASAMVELVSRTIAFQGSGVLTDTTIA